VPPVFLKQATPSTSSLLKSDASPSKRDGRVRDKDARIARSSATRATEDAASRFEREDVHGAVGTYVPTAPLVVPEATGRFVDQLVGFSVMSS